MGREGNKLDTFVSQLSRNMAVCKMESFWWTDFSVLIMINTLRSSDKNKEKLAKRLNRLYDTAESENRVLDIATMQQEVRSFWRTVKENQELTFKGNRNQEGSGNQGCPGQNAGGQKENRKRKRKNKGKEKKIEKVSNVTGGDKGEVRYCFKCGLEDHIAKDCKKSSPLKCIAHPEATSHENCLCWVW